MFDKFRSRKTLRNPTTAHSVRQGRQRKEDQRVCAKDDNETNKTKKPSTITLINFRFYSYFAVLKGYLNCTKTHLVYENPSCLFA